VVYGSAHVDARPSDDLFWDEAFAWAPTVENAAAEPAPPSEPEQAAERIRLRRRELRAHRTARALEAQRRRRTRLYPLLAALAVLVVGVTVATTGGGEPAAEQPAPAPPPATAPSPSPTPAAVPVVETANMKMGDEGESVRALQQALTAVGFDAGAPDGGFAAKTRDAVAAFQREAGLVGDGVVGPQTALALTRALGERAGTQAALARDGLDEAVGAGRLSAEAGERYGAMVDDALTAFDGMTLGRAANLALVLDDVATQAPEYDEPRALTLFTMLEANARHLATHDPPRRSIDIEGEDGVVYRFFRARGFHFHPIANFATLNKHVTQGRREEARRLGAALVARGVPGGKGLLWEYYFSFGGPPRWTSGFAQAVAADALSRAGVMAEDEALLDAARRAFLAIPEKLSRPLAGGAWIREYGFSDIAILNAQLQSLLSLSRYAETASDEEARAFAGELESASRDLLHEFDRGGCWSLYSLDGGPAPPHYHRYHVALLEMLDERTGDPPWGETARRWKQACGSA
jgi:peptidoglycan hydrolase-like protein with peptidoglycan-binding domain